MVNLKFEDNETPQVSKEIFEKTKKELGFVPNMYQKMGNNSALLDAYTHSYNTFRVNSGFTPIEQEVVFLSVAYENNCEYCMAAHSFVSDTMSKVPSEVTEAIRNGQPIPNLKLDVLSKITRSLTVNRGIVSQQEIDAFLAVGYTEVHVLGIITGIGVKTLSNYSNHIASPKVDDAFAGRIWKKN